MTAAGTDTLCLHSNDAADLSWVVCFIGLSILSWAHVVPSFHLSLIRKLSHAMCQLGGRGTVVEDFSANLRKSNRIAICDLPQK